MMRSVFLKTLHDQRKSILGWGLGLGALAYFTLLFYPSVALVHKSPSFGRKWGDLPDSGFSTWL